MKLLKHAPVARESSGSVTGLPLMRRTLLNSKNHRATATQADIDPEVSAIIDADLMKPAEIPPFEKLQADGRFRRRAQTHHPPGPREPGTGKPHAQTDRERRW